MISKIFKNKKVNWGLLEKYGFSSDGEDMVYQTYIHDEQFSLVVKVSDVGDVSTKLVDLETNEEYVLHLLDTAVGEYVGEIREEYEKVLSDISTKCFEKEIFRSEQAKRLIKHVREKYGDELEFLWEKFDDVAILRRKDNQKWYAVLFVLPKRKLGVDDVAVVDVLDLRSGEVEKVVDGCKYFAGYHMNKKHWLTMCLDDSVSDAEIFSRLDESYILAKKK